MTTQALTNRYDVARWHIEQCGGLVTAAELARRWDISRERARQLADTPGFPEPLPLPGRVKVYLAGECERWRGVR